VYTKSTDRLKEQLLIYTPTESPRIHYIMDWFFGQILGPKQYCIVNNYIAFIQKESVAKLNYSTLPTPNIPTIIPNGLLNESNIKSFTPTFQYHQNLPAAFFSPKDDLAALPFDIFALTFYLLSRYEEYLDTPKDQHQRFTAHQSMAYQNNFLELPLVDLWRIQLKNILQQHYPKLLFKNSTYQYTPTYDIDYAYAFSQKGWIRQIGAFARNCKNRDLPLLKIQLKTWLRLQKDPYDCFEYLKSLDKKHQLSPIYFWLVGDYGHYDKNIAPSNKKFQSLIQQNAAQFPIGIHPSYASNDAPLLLDKEINRLETISRQRIAKSRQHYLKLTLPDTYQRLVQYRIQEDYTMGYAQELGFRASTAQPFSWFNLKANRPEELQVYPFQIMDVTLKNYLKYSPQKVIEAASQIIQQTKAVNGHLITIWHNSSLGECMGWESWRDVYETILSEAAP
jgi:hypothetical protein